MKSTYVLSVFSKMSAHHKAQSLFSPCSIPLLCNHLAFFLCIIPYK